MKELYSIIIPTLNEEKQIAACLQNIKNCLPNCEIIVVDGGSADRTVNLAEMEGVIVLSSEPSRGGQCRVGAEAAKGEILIFLHVDSILEAGTLGLLNKEFLDSQHAVATFSVLFNGAQRRYRFFEWCARFETMFTTYGDQGIIVTKKFYTQQVSIPDQKLFEDVEFFRKARKQTKIIKLNIPIVTSVRRFEKKGFWRANIGNSFLFFAYTIGVKETTLHRLYYAGS